MHSSNAADRTTFSMSSFMRLFTSPTVVTLKPFLTTATRTYYSLLKATSANRTCTCASLTWHAPSPIWTRDSKIVTTVKMRTIQMSTHCPGSRLLCYRSLTFLGFLAPTYFEGSRDGDQSVGNRLHCHRKLVHRRRHRRSIWRCSQGDHRAGLANDL